MKGHFPLPVYSPMGSLLGGYHGWQVAEASDCQPEDPEVLHRPSPSQLRMPYLRAEPLGQCSEILPRYPRRTGLVEGTSGWRMKRVPPKGISKRLLARPMLLSHTLQNTSGSLLPAIAMLVQHRGRHGCTSAVRCLEKASFVQR